MKIGIITLHSKVNYGALFQAYALQTILSAKGNDVMIIDYWPMYRRVASGNFRKSSHVQKNVLKRIGIGCWRFTNDLINIGQRRMRELYFTEFMSTHLHLSKTYLDYDNLRTEKPDCDFFVVGSDQVWNPQITGGQLDPAYFLAFVGNPDCCAAYAASMGSNSIETKDITIFRELISNIHHISVRETSAISFIEKETGRKAVAVLDPTLLLRGENWQENSHAPCDRPENFLLVFTIGHNPTIVPLVRRVATELCLNVKYIGEGQHLLLSKISYVRPEEWLWYFSNASFIITDSFHGTVFSIINNKPFYTIHSTSKKARMIDLLMPLGLMDRFSESGNTITFISSDIDYDTVMEKLDELRSDSLTYLGNILNQEMPEGL